MIRLISDRPDQLADDIVAMIEATARLGLSPEGQASDGDLQDVLERVQRRLLVRLDAGGCEVEPSATPLRRLGGRVSER